MMLRIIISPKILLSFVLLLATLNSLTTIPVFQINNNYLQADTYTVNTSPLTGNTSADAFNFFSYSLTFSRTHSLYKATCSLINLDFKFTAIRQMNVTTFICGRNSSALDLCVQTRLSSRISALSLRYILVDSPLSTKLTHIYSIGSYYVQNAGTKVFDSSNPASVSFGIPIINVGTATKSIVGINGVNASCTDNSLSMDIKIASFYSSSVVLQVDITSSTATILNLASVAVWIIGFNIQDAMAWPWPAIKATVGSFLTNSPFSDTGNLIQTYNTFWGVSYLKTTNQASLTFNSSLAVNTSITGVSVDQNFEWKFIVFQVKECDASTPYYMMSEDICYDICPNFFYESNSDKLCKACTATAYDCLKCVTNQTCSSCNTDTRVLNAATKRCDPKTGYYESGSFNASACNSNCKTCSQASINCTSCQMGYYLTVNNTCSPCISNCDNCNNGASCNTCSNSYYLDSNGLCVLGINCSQISNCNNCTIIAGCTQCSAGYSQINSTLCSSICGDGLLSPTEECDIGNHTDGCINCYIEAAHFCTGSVGSLSTCNDCAVNCLNCTSLTTCSLCEDYFQILPNNSCQANCSEINFCLICSVVSNSVRCSTCANGYGVSSSYQCISVCGNGVIIGSQGCDDNNTLSGDGCSSTCIIQDGFACTINNSKSVCVPCLGATYQSTDKSSCLPCANYDCSKCLPNGHCLTCNASQNRYLDVNTHRCRPLDGFYDDGTNKTALPCDLQCVTCSGAGNNTCLSCRSNEVLVTSTCNKCSVVSGKSCGACYKSGSSFLCTLCLDTTVLENGSCITPPLSQKTEKSGVNLLLILLPLLLGLLCCCCLILFCIWRRRKNEQNKVEQELEQGVQVQNNEKNQQAIKVEELDESKAAFDQKALTMKKKKYRGDPNKNNIKSKKRRVPLPQETEENELSLEQFKDTLQMRHSQTKKKTSFPDKEAAMHVIPAQQESHQQAIQKLGKQQKQKKQEKEEVINQDKVADQPKEDGVKSQMHNEDITRDRDRSEFSDNETRQIQDQQEEGRGR